MTSKANKGSRARQGGPNWTEPNTVTVIWYDKNGSRQTRTETIEPGPLRPPEEREEYWRTRKQGRDPGK